MSPDPHAGSSTVKALTTRPQPTAAQGQSVPLIDAVRAERPAVGLRSRSQFDDGRCPVPSLRTDLVELLSASIRRPGQIPH